MYLLWSQDADGDVTHYGMNEDTDVLDEWLERHCEQMEIDFPVFTYYDQSKSALMYAQANDMDWWLEPVEQIG